MLKLENKPKLAKKVNLTQKGFTLFELMICLALIGLFLGISLDSVQILQKKNDASSIIDIILEAKSDALFASNNIQLEFFSSKLDVYNYGELSKSLEFDEEFKILLVNGLDPSFAPTKITVNKFGMMEETLIIFRENFVNKSLYVPAIGAIIPLDSPLTIENVYKEIL